MNETKKCPYCGQEIKAVAKKCRHCGEWLDGEVKTDNGSKNPNKSKLIYFVIGSVVIIIGLVLLLFLKPSNASDVGTKEESSDTIAIEESDYDPYARVDELEKRDDEYEARLTPEERENEPWRIWLKKLQGSYLIDRRSSLADINMVHNYGKYVISGNTITKYEWSESSNSWTPEFSSEFQLFKFHEDGYMSGYNLIYTDQYGIECRMCSGEANGDGVMDLWQSDSMFWTKQ